MPDGDHRTTLTTDDVPDEIVRSIHIDASAEVVWEIVSEPGWFINDGTPTDHQVVTTGSVSRMTDPNHGAFEIETLELDPPHRALFRWLGGDVGALEDFPTNTIEFLIEPDGTGVRLTVRERGFAGISRDAAVRRRRFEENTSGWIEELALARALAQDAPASA